jgi:osmotically-inducible protein OsmY
LKFYYKKMSKKLLVFLILFILPSCIETVAVVTFGSGYLLARDKTISETVIDSTILTKATNSLVKNNKDGKFSKINISVYDGRVLLAGYSSEKTYVQEAIKLIWQINNVKEVINEVSYEDGDKTQNHIKDFALLANIKSQIIWNSELKAKDVNITIYNGRIYILGNAENEDKIKAIAEISSGVKGVKKVISHIKS